MKKIFVLATLVLAFVLTACSPSAPKAAPTAAPDACPHDDHTGRCATTSEDCDVDGKPRPN